MKKFKLAALPLLVVSGLATANTNLVENGSFETDVVSQKWALVDVISGWQRSDNAQAEIQTNSLGIIDAVEGTQYIELDSTENYSIKQTIATQAGKTYSLSFSYSARVADDEDTNAAEVLWNGEVVAELNSSTPGWEQHTVTLTGADDVSVLTFAGTGTDDSYGAFIDDVKLEAVCDVTTGLYGMNKFGSASEGFIYHLDTETGSSTSLIGVNNTASNIASKDGVLYFMEQLDSSTKASQVLAYDLASKEQTLVNQTVSYPIYRSAVTPDGLSLRATSKTYMYDFDLETGAKTVLGKLTYPGDSFSDGDIAYSADNNVLYVLTGKALYTLDEGSLDLSLVGEHGINWASGIAVSDEGTIFVSGRVSGENAKIYSLDQNTAEPTFVMEGPDHINDLTFVSDSICQ
ncbi:DUF642 domain-containing protein [Pseudoalteromonas sp. MMG010]|uniref:DUF642 domain-containing protein n=1 Tax=Pseudoalteromonas sp. MMG010 TaxID=2822685 RepID=UPI001B39DF3C|nr:DUF642 domain-containing protein [Pseudoalteromonas sp. MMG010]MBQ4833092.1 DUF642 domain-containing protein [Pseudoalteromonas sp. MMG010]